MRLRLRYRKDDPGHNVIVAVSRWIKANGGNVVMIGGIGIIREGLYQYSVAVPVTALAPKKQ